MKHSNHFQHYTVAAPAKRETLWDILTIVSIAGALTVLALAYFDILFI